MREMKDSGVEWIGEIPKEWKLTQARRLFNIYIVLIERYDLYTTEREKRIIIDKDSCLIYDK